MNCLAPSILAADFGHLADAVTTADDAGAQYLHFDVMDGHFVPNISFGMPVLESVRSLTERILDVHMMVERPEKKGLRALGADKLPQTEGTAAEAEGETMAHARGTVRYWVLAVSVLLISAGCSSLVMTLSPHLTDSGYSAAFAAGMVSVSMGAMAVGKMLLGWLYDVLGAKRASLLSVLCGFLGLLGMIFCRVTPALGLIILGVGLGCAFGTVGPPIVVMNVFGKRDYSAIVGVFISFGNIGGAIAPTVNGTVYDLAGSYTPGYAAWAVALGLVLFCFTIFLPSGRKEQ